VSFVEAAAAATAWDAYARDGSEHPVYADRPDGCGARFFAGGIIPTVTTALTSILAYPNPYKPNNRDLTDGVPYRAGYANTGITFANLPPGAHFTVFSAMGETIMETVVDGTGEVQWGATNTRNEPVASGIYLWHVTAPSGGHRSGKVAIQR